MHVKHCPTPRLSLIALSVRLLSDRHPSLAVFPGGIQSLTPCNLFTPAEAANVQMRGEERRKDEGQNQRDSAFPVWAAELASVSRRQQEVS